MATRRQAKHDRPLSIPAARNETPRRGCRLARPFASESRHDPFARQRGGHGGNQAWKCRQGRSEEHTSELQSLMRISYAVFCLKKKNQKNQPYLSRQKHQDIIQRNTHTITSTSSTPDNRTS